uniref:Vasoactive intestinal peptide receptor 2 n=1 Tax=Myripristis murdjan TaxID=586833 RepID=A0A667Z8R7_9TELE
CLAAVTKEERGLFIGVWDNISCWQNAAVGEVMTLGCPAALQHLFGKNGNISRNCTEDGWTVVYPSVYVACWSEDSDDSNEVVKILYTLGHSLSLIALLTSAAILCLFRRLHCTRNYIHLNLFVSFILRAVAVLTKDAILFSHAEHADCSTQPSLVGCKTSLVLLNYFIMANFFWLLVEGLYLHTLLLVMHTYSSRLPLYVLIGWGEKPASHTHTHTHTLHYSCTHVQRCWERNENPVPKRVINWPIMASVIINFILFISIIRILVQKLRCSDVGGNSQSQYRRLAKSTLLLIPLFGVNYVVFVYLVDTTDKNMEHFKIFFDLGFCFPKCCVQGELRRTWRSLSLKRYVGQDYRLHAMSVSRNGTDNSAHCPRNSRAQSILQTETTML